MAEIRVLSAGDEAILESFLAPNLASSMFLINNLRISGLDYQDVPFHGTYVGAFEAGELCAVIAQFWNGVLIPQAPVHIQPLVEFLLNESDREVRGFVGPLDQVTQIVDRLGFGPEDFSVDGPEKLYHCDLKAMLIPKILSSQQAIGRLCEHSDLELMIEWRKAYCIEALNAEDSQALRDECEVSIQTQYEDQRLWLLEVDGQPVSTTSFNAAIKEAVQVGGVYTPPELRGKGYGRAAVAASLLGARESGVGQSILFTEEDNFAAQRAYEAIGFKQIGQFRLGLLKG